MVTAPVLGMCLLLVNIKYQWVFTQYSLDKWDTIELKY